MSRPDGLSAVEPYCPECGRSYLTEPHPLGAEVERLRVVADAAARVVNADDWRSGAEWDEALADLAEALASLDHTVDTPTPESLSNRG